MPPAWEPSQAIIMQVRAGSGCTRTPPIIAAAERVWGRHANKDEMARAAASWSKHDLEMAIVASMAPASAMLASTRPRNVLKLVGHSA